MHEIHLFLLTVTIRSVELNSNIYWRDFADRVVKRIFQTGDSLVVFGGRFYKNKIFNKSLLSPVSHETHFRYVGFDSSNSHDYFYRKSKAC